MALQALVDDIETLDEGLRGFYRKLEIEDENNPMHAHNGRYVLDVAPVAGVAIDHTEGLKSSLSQARTERDDANKKLQTFDGIDPIDVKTKLEKLEKLQKIDPTKEADKLADEKVQAVKDAAQKEVAKLTATGKGREDKLTAQIRNLLLTSDAKSALSKHGGDVELLLPHIERQARVREKDDGSFVVEVLDKGGTTRLKDMSNPMSLEDLVTEMKSIDPFAKAFDAENSGSRSSSSGNPGGPSNGGTKNPWKNDTLNLTEQARITRETPDVAKRLKAEAGAV